MTQKEFDQQMHVINDAWIKERMALENANIELNKRRDALRRAINEMKSQLDSIREKYSENVMAIKIINIKYHSMKHEFIVVHPKSSMEDEVNG